MDARAHKTNVLEADGEVVWSWRSEAGAKVAGISRERRWQKRWSRGERAISVCRGKARFSRGCKSLPARVAPAGSNRSSGEGNEPAEASDGKGHK